MKGKGIFFLSLQVYQHTDENFCSLQYIEGKASPLSPLIGFSYVITENQLTVWEERFLLGLCPMDSITPVPLHPGDSMACPFDDMDLQI